MQFTQTLIAMVAACASTASAISTDATFYNGPLSAGACGYTTYTLPSNIFGTALGASQWNGGAQCGKCVSVKGPMGNSITAMVVDLCVGCGNGLDLFADGFSAIGQQADGRINIEYDFVACPTDNLPSGGNFN